MGILKDIFIAPKKNTDGSLKHIIKDGARYHVISFHSDGLHCSEPNCEINKKRERMHYPKYEDTLW